MRAREFLTEYKKRVVYKGVTLDIFADGANIGISAMDGNNQMGYVVFDRDGNNLVSDDTAVDDVYRGKGIAKLMYDYVKDELGFNIRASSDQTTAGKAFWKKNRGEERVWESEQ